MKSASWLHNVARRLRRAAGGFAIAALALSMAGLGTLADVASLYAQGGGGGGGAGGGASAAGGGSAAGGAGGTATGAAGGVGAGGAAGAAGATPATLATPATPALGAGGAAAPGPLGSSVGPNGQLIPNTTANPLFGPATGGVNGAVGGAATTTSTPGGTLNGATNPSATGGAAGSLRNSTNLRTAPNAFNARPATGPTGAGATGDASATGTQRLNIARDGRNPTLREAVDNNPAISGTLGTTNNTTTDANSTGTNSTGTTSNDTTTSATTTPGTTTSGTTTSGTTTTGTIGTATGATAPIPIGNAADPSGALTSPGGVTSSGSASFSYAPVVGDTSGAGTTNVLGLQFAATGAVAPTSATGTAATGVATTDPGTGLTVSGLTTGGIAALAGIRQGDQIFSINGTPVGSFGDFTTALQTAGLQSGLTTIGIRRNGQVHTMQVNLAAAGQAGAQGGTGGFGGLSFVNDQGGLRISQLAPNSWAATSGLQLNDQITAINGQLVNSTSAMLELMRTAANAGGTVNVTVTRNGLQTPVALTLSPQTFASSPNQSAFNAPGAYVTPSDRITLDPRTNQPLNSGVMPGAFAPGEITPLTIDPRTNQPINSAAMPGAFAPVAGTTTGTATTANGTATGTTTGTAGTSTTGTATPGTTTTGATATGTTATGTTGGATLDGTTGSGGTASGAAILPGTTGQPSTAATQAAPPGNGAALPPSAGGSASTARPELNDAFNTFATGYREALVRVPDSVRPQLTALNSQIDAIRSSIAPVPGETAAARRERLDGVRVQMNTLRHDLSGIGSDLSGDQARQIEAIRSSFNDVFNQLNDSAR